MSRYPYTKNKLYRLLSLAIYSSLKNIRREEENLLVPGQLRSLSTWISLNLGLAHSEFPETSAGGSADVLDVEEERGVRRDDARGGLPPSAPGALLAVGQRRWQLQRPLTP